MVAPAKKNALEVIPWERVGVQLSNPARTIKMLQPICPETINLETGSASPGCETKHKDFGAWWQKCEEKGHNPYIQVFEHPVRTPVVETTEDGRRLIVGYKEELELRESPRTIQVPLGPRFNSGQFLEEKRFFHGYKYPHEMGYADMCEFRNCFAPNPEINTRYGAFCREDEARMITADARHTVLEVLNPEKRATQIEEINV